jgi:hypothetical protein
MSPETYLESLVMERCPSTDPASEGIEEDPCFGSLKLRGMAADHRQVGLLIQRLITAEVFSEVALVSTRNAGRQVEFEILCRMEGEGSTPVGLGYGALQAERLYE